MKLSNVPINLFASANLHVVLLQACSFPIHPEASQKLKNGIKSRFRTQLWCSLRGSKTYYQTWTFSFLVLPAYVTGCPPEDTIRSRLGLDRREPPQRDHPAGGPAGYRRSRQGASRQAIAVSRNSLPPFVSFLAVWAQRQWRDRLRKLR